MVGWKYGFQKAFCRQSEHFCHLFLTEPILERAKPWRSYLYKSIKGSRGCNHERVAKKNDVQSVCGFPKYLTGYIFKANTFTWRFMLEKKKIDIKSLNICWYSDTGQFFFKFFSIILVKGTAGFLIKSISLYLKLLETSRVFQPVNKTLSSPI